MTFALRAFSLAFLGWHGALLLPGLAEPWFFALAGVLGLTGGTMVRTWRWELGLVAAGAAVALWGVLTGVPAWVDLGPWVDNLPLWADRQALGVLPFVLGWFEGWMFSDRPRRRVWERLVNAWVVVGVFWSQGPYHVTFYPNPLVLALVFGLFLAAELVLLMGRPPRSLFRVASFGVALAGLGLLWGLLGRYEDQSTASGGGLMKPDLFQFDFAPLIRLEDEISLGDNLVLLYREDGTPQARYLRRMVLEDYQASQGFSVAGGKPPVVGRKAQTFPPGDGTQDRIPVRQEYYLVNLDPSSFLALNTPVTLTPYAQWNHSSFVNAYRVDSLVAGQDFWVFNEKHDTLAPAERARLLAGGQDPEIQALARTITRGADTPYEKATAIELYLRENYYYSLKPGAAGSRGALKHFLFEGKKGYCSYFAFSMTLLLRSLDVPARIAVGFATNPDDSVMGFTPVRAFQAHAWVEVPFGTSGWLEFDPTSSTPAPGEPFQFPKATDRQTLSQLIAEILEAQPQPVSGQTAPEAAPEAFSWDRWRGWGSTGILVLLVLVVGVNEGFRHRWWWARWTSRDPRRRVALWWDEVRHRARRVGMGPQPGETPEAWADRRGAPEEKAFSALVSQFRYASTPIPEDEVQVAECARLLRRRYDEIRPWYHRAASGVFPWWPR